MTLGAQVFTVGVFWGTETFAWPTLGNLLVITVGVIIAAYGEINFVLVRAQRRQIDSSAKLTIPERLFMLLVQLAHLNADRGWGL